MSYWFDAYTGTTWDEFRKAGACVTGFRDSYWNLVEQLRPGDILLCYMVGVKRWVGLLEVIGDRFRDQAVIFEEELFSVRLPVKPLVLLDPEFGVSMKELEGKLSFLPRADVNWSIWVRKSLRRYEEADGDVIAAAVRQAEKCPVSKPISAKALNRPANLYVLKEASSTGQKRIVSVPSDDAEEADDKSDLPLSSITHTEIQWRLLDLGSRMGLRDWAPRSDRAKSWNGGTIGEISNSLDTLPTQFDEVTQRTIENIDVLWLSGNAIAAAFEVEHSTSIYSGLLRMSDLLTMQPNIDIKLYLVAPEERHRKFKSEVARATFAASRRPLHEMCGFLPYSALCNRPDEVKNVLPYLKSDFIDDITEYYDPAQEFDT